MNQTIVDAIGQSCVAYGFVPILNWQLTADDGGRAVAAVFEDFHLVTSLRDGQDNEALIIVDQPFHAVDGF